jgi:site-specific DNA recombinase
VLTGKTDGIGRPIRSHVTRKVHEPEAAVVREIFERYANGQGLKRIADNLNRKGTPTPRPRKIKVDGVVRPIRPPSWAPSNVRSILLQPLYRGVARWNRLKQHDDDGPQAAKINPEGEQFTFYDPSWRIVSDAVTDAVDARFADEDRKKFKSKVGVIRGVASGCRRALLVAQPAAHRRPGAATAVGGLRPAARPARRAQ